MSWTSPLTVASNNFAARGGFGLLHELLQVADGSLHGFGGLQHLGDN